MTAAPIRSPEPTRCANCGTVAAQTVCNVCKTPRPGFEPKPKGGRRAGAGRPPIYDKQMPRYSVVLDEATASRLRERGGGSISEGIRDIAKRMRKKRRGVNSGLPE